MGNQGVETTFIKTAMGDRNAAFKNKNAKETLNKSLPLIGSLKLEEECVDKSPRPKKEEGGGGGLQIRKVCEEHYVNTCRRSTV